MSISTIPAEVVKWLADGERGLSSEAMCKRLYGLPENAGSDHPHDPADLRRCVTFLRETNSFPLISRMEDVSPYWAVLVRNWDRLMQIYHADCAEETGYARKTYEFMKDLFAKA